jgi:predicted Fe-Mo cluster-binding NifX family protein
MKHLKIAIPTNGRNGLDEKIAEHFGRCGTYTFLNENGDILEIIENTSEHMGGKGLPPELMKARGANILLCRDLGPKALSLCEEFGIEVYVGQAETVKDIFEMRKNNKLKKATLNDVCEEHKL